MDITATTVVDRLSGLLNALKTSKGVTTSPSDDRTIPAPDASWRRGVLRLDESHHPKVEMLGKVVEWFCRACLRNNREKGHWLVIAGGPGCGKTHCAEIAAAYIGERQIDAYRRGWLQNSSVYAPAFIRWETVADMDDGDFAAILDRLIMPARAVILDDVGAETDRFKSGVPLVRFKAVLDACSHKWLLITTNIPKRNWQKTFETRTADRLMSARFLGLFEVPSYRGKQRPVEP